VSIEHFGATLAGLVLSSYFAGFTLSALLCSSITERVGHVRAYAAFAGLAVATTATMPLLLGPLSWIVLRVGFGCAELFIAAESWLNAKAQPASRRRAFATYVAGTFVALAIRQPAAPTRLCAYYRLDQQALAGWTLITVAVGLGILWFLAAFIGWPPARQDAKSRWHGPPIATAVVGDLDA